MFISATLPFQAVELYGLPYDPTEYHIILRADGKLRLQPNYLQEDKSKHHSRSFVALGNLCAKDEHPTRTLRLAFPKQGSLRHVPYSARTRRQSKFGKHRRL